ncbi:MAG: class II aldolase/adducin family protein [Victivallales bacterium]|nr:class II aldolase/adducin family protein [Victivallales bacterium]
MKMETEAGRYCTMTDDHLAIRREIAGFMRRLYRQRLTTASGGNISVRCGDMVLITPSGTDKGRLRADQVGMINLDGTPVADSSDRLSMETGLHLAVYRCRPDIAAIVHAHPPLTCAFAAAAIKLETAFLSEPYALLGDVATAEYALMGSPELAAHTAAAAVRANAVLMRNHGALTVGGTLLEAFDRMEVLENAAMVNWQLRQLPPEQHHRLTADELREIDRLMQRR